MRSTLAFVVPLLLVSVKAGAQCAPNDAMTPARRARHVVEAVARADGILDADEALVAQVETEHRELVEPDRYRVFGAVVLAGSGFQKMPVCTNTGVSKGTFAQTQAGVIAGARHDRTGLELRLQFHHVVDDLDSRESPAGHASFATSQAALGGALQWRQWVRLEMLGVVPSSRSATNDGEGTSIVQPAGEVGSRFAIGLAVPSFRLSTHGLVDPSKGAVDTVSFGVTRLPLAGTPLEATAAVLVIRDERQTAGLLGLTYVLDHGPPAERTSGNSPDEQVLGRWGKTTIHGEASFERPRLRHARLQLDSFSGARTLYGTHRRFLGHANAGLQGDITYFGSAHSLRQTSSSAGVFGASAGIYVQVSSRYASLQFDLSGGVNRPETLARLSSARNVGEGRAMLYLKLGRGRRRAS